MTIYTWRDATLRELADLIAEVNVECRRRDARFSFQLVWTDLRGRPVFKPLGSVTNSRPSRDDGRTLEEVRFVQGDFIDVAISFGTSQAITLTNGGGGISNGASGRITNRVTGVRRSSDNGSLYRDRDRDLINPPLNQIVRRESYNSRNSGPRRDYQRTYYDRDSSRYRR